MFNEMLMKEKLFEMVNLVNAIGIFVKEDKEALQSLRNEVKELKELVRSLKKTDKEEVKK